eukprot:01981_6
MCCDDGGLLRDVQHKRPKALGQLIGDAERGRVAALGEGTPDLLYHAPKLRGQSRALGIKLICLMDQFSL